MEIHVSVIPPEEKMLPNGTIVFEVDISELNVRQYLYLPFEEFHRTFNAPEGIEADLLVVAGIVYLVDQLVPRSSFPDNWTRELSLSIPVDNPETWAGASEVLVDALQFLTGDRWHFVFTNRYVPIYHYRERRLRAKPLLPALTTCLFSGGLDSLVGAIDLLEDQKNVSVTLVSHYDLGSTARKAQTNLARQLQQEYPSRINLIQCRVGGISSINNSQGIFGAVQNPHSKETTFRSRSLIFLALGLYIAKQHSIETCVPLFIPENGFIALNPPLTDARLGSCSTKTTHPLFLDKFHRVAQSLGIPNSISIPLINKSKGSALAHSSNLDLVKTLAPYSISCAHPTRRQGWYRRDVTHCGYCVPCLIRRASLHQIGLDQGSDYGFDVWAGELGLAEDIAVDLRAVLSWVYNATNNGRTSQAIVRKLHLPLSHQEAAQQVIQSALDELAQIISDKAEHRIKHWAGL